MYFKHVHIICCGHMYYIFIFIKFYWIGTLFWCFFITLIISRHLVWFVPLKHNGSQDLVIIRKRNSVMNIFKKNTFEITIWLHPVLVLPCLWMKSDFLSCSFPTNRIDYYIAFGIFFILSFEEEEGLFISSLFLKNILSQSLLPRLLVLYVCNCG